MYKHFYDSCERPYSKKCRPNFNSQMPGTVLRIHIPPGAVINLLNIAEVCSPNGISLLVRVPLLAGSTGLNSFMNTITGAGGSVCQMNDCDCEEYYDPCYR